MKTSIVSSQLFGRLVNFLDSFDLAVGGRQSAITTFVASDRWSGIAMATLTLLHRSTMSGLTLMPPALPSSLLTAVSKTSRVSWCSTKRREESPRYDLVKVRLMTS